MKVWILLFSFLLYVYIWIHLHNLVCIVYFIFKIFLSYFRISFKWQFNYEIPPTFLSFLPRHLCVFSFFLFTPTVNKICTPKSSLLLGLSWNMFKSSDIILFKWNWFSFPKQPSDDKAPHQGVWLYTTLSFSCCVFNPACASSGLMHANLITWVHMWKSPNVCRKHYLLVVVHCLWPLSSFIILSWAILEHCLERMILTYHLKLNPFLLSEL